MAIIKDAYIKILTNTALFKGIEESTLRGMIGCFVPRVNQYGKLSTIVVAGEPFTGIGLVLKGEIIVAKESFAGNRTIVTVLKAGDMFGEMVSFNENKRWPATVTAQSDCEVIFISPEKVIHQCHQVCAGHQKMIENLLGIMSKKALMLNKKLEYLSIRSLRGRLGAYLLEQYQKTGELMFILPMNRDELADFFNVSRPSISRELGKMREDGLIDFHRSSFKILSLDKIKGAVES